MNFKKSAVLLLVVPSVSAFAQAIWNHRSDSRLAEASEACMADGGCLTPSVAGVDSRDPATIYHAICYACHASGGANAPMISDTAAWNERFAKGRDVLYQNAIVGLNLMPPKGLCFQCTDEEIRATVDYILSAAGL